MLNRTMEMGKKIAKRDIKAIDKTIEAVRDCSVSLQLSLNENPEFNQSKISVNEDLISGMSHSFCASERDAQASVINLEEEKSRADESVELELEKPEETQNDASGETQTQTFPIKDKAEVSAPETMEIGSNLDKIFKNNNTGDIPRIEPGGEICIKCDQQGGEMMNLEKCKHAIHK